MVQCDEYLFTEVKAEMSYVRIGMGYRFGALLVSLIALWLMLVDQNPFGLVFFLVWWVI